VLETITGVDSFAGKSIENKEEGERGAFRGGVET
jgi:hypothetical protein